MKKAVFALVVVAALYAVPAISEAADVCFTNAFGQFFRFKVTGSCKSTNTTIGEIHGRWQPGGQCLPGVNAVPLHGTCTGDKNSGQVITTITTETLSSCVPVMWLMRGPAVNNATGVFDNAPFGSTTGGDTWFPIACGAEPPFAPEPPEGDVVPGRP